MENLKFTTEDEKTIKKKETGLFIAIAATVAVVILLAIIGFLTIKPAKEIVQGQVDGTNVRVSGLMPGRIERFYVEEGQTVRKGDTLVKIQSATVDAKLAQALAMQDAAQAQKEKADAGARKQVISAAYDLWKQAEAALEIRRKTYDRMESLFRQNVVSAQKRDEAKAAFDAAKAAESAAKAQYEMAKEGAQKEDKLAAQAMVAAARGTVQEVESILRDQYLLAPCDGEIIDIFPNEGELVSTGTPIMNVLKADKKWIVFNVRETMLKDLPSGKEVKVSIPALGLKGVAAKVFYIKDMGDYAVWRATKVTGEYDSRTFEVKMHTVEPIKDIRPGMTVILE